jgi:7-keto-8-aminopelargonate synthetase-like enzyme
MLYEARVAQEIAARLLDEGIYVIGFSYPVVAKDQRASACKSPPRTNRTISIAPSPPSPKSARP